MEYNIPCEEEVYNIPSENWITWLKSEYDNDCCKPTNFTIITNKEELEDKYSNFDYIISFKTFCSELNQTYCYVTPIQYENIKNGFYNTDIENKKSDRLEIIKFMGFKSKFPKNKRDSNRIFYKNIKSSKTDTYQDEKWIYLNSGHNDFRPDNKLEDLYYVLDYIESLPSTLKTIIELNNKQYTFTIVLQDGVTTKGLEQGKRFDSRIDAVYNGVINYIKWRNLLDYESTINTD